MLDGYEQKINPEPLWTIEQVAAYLSIARITVYRMIKRGELNVIRMGKRLRIPEGEIKRLSGQIQETLKSQPLK